MERDTGRSKGFGFVEMGSDAEAQAAINGMNGQPLGGRSVVVNEARPMATLHARIRADASSALVKKAIRERLQSRFHVDHATVEIEDGDHAPLCR